MACGQRQLQAGPFHPARPLLASPPLEQQANSCPLLSVAAGQQASGGLLRQGTALLGRGHSSAWCHCLGPGALGAGLPCQRRSAGKDERGTCVSSCQSRGRSLERAAGAAEGCKFRVPPLLPALHPPSLVPKQRRVCVCVWAHLADEAVQSPANGAAELIHVVLIDTPPKAVGRPAVVAVLRPALGHRQPPLQEALVLLQGHQLEGRGGAGSEPCPEQEWLPRSVGSLRPSSSSQGWAPLALPSPDSLPVSPCLGGGRCRRRNRPERGRTPGGPGCS